MSDDDERMPCLQYPQRTFCQMVSRYTDRWLKVATETMEIIEESDEMFEDVPMCKGRFEHPCGWPDEEKVT